MRPSPNEGFLNAVQAGFEALGCRDSRVLLAVSGGADSVAMMQAACVVAKDLGLELVVGTVDHGLRAEATRETEQVALLAQRFGLLCEIGRLSLGESYVGRTRGSLQEWARLRRYELLGNMARRLECRFLATAHTLDDQAETVLLRLIRGTGIEGLAGISPIRSLDPDGEICLVRPLLGVRRLEVEAYLSGMGLGWIEDPSNRDPRFVRVRVRTETLPSLEQIQPGVASRLASLADEARVVHAYLEGQLAESNDLIKKIRLFGGVKVEYQVFERLPRPMWGHVLRMALREVRGDLRRIERVHIEPIEALVEQRKSTGALPLPGEATVHLDQGDVYIFAGPLPDPPTGAGQPCPVGAGQWRVRFAALGAVAEVRCDRPEIASELEVRSRRAGDRLYGSRSKLKELLMKRKVPRPYRDFVPVLAYGDEIVSAPMILSSRMSGLEVNWLMEAGSPVLDLGFEV